MVSYASRPSAVSPKPGRWRIKRLPCGEAISSIITNKRQLRTALLEWRAQEEDGPRPLPREGYTIYARNNGVRTALGMANTIIWSYRKIRPRTQP
jgi:hypothetical protein